MENLECEQLHPVGEIVRDNSIGMFIGYLVHR